MRLAAVVLLAVLSAVDAFSRFPRPLSSGASSGLANSAVPKWVSPRLNTKLMAAKQPEGKRTRRRSKRKREADGADAPNLSMRDFEVDQLIEDERKTELPRLDQLKVRGSGNAPKESGRAETLLLPREIEAMKLKEKVEEEVKGAPSYFPTMTKITWGAIFLMVVVELVVQSPLVPRPTGIPMQ